MVEGGRIDHGHHAGNAQRALTETIEFANAVTVALQKTKPTDTLIVVTADHSHTLDLGLSQAREPDLAWWSARSARERRATSR
jgi:alkaline phosphatase